MFARWYSDTLHNKRISRACTPQYQWWWWFVGSIKMSLSHTRIRLALGATRSVFLFFWFWSLQVDADFVCSVRISQKRTLFYYLDFFRRMQFKRRQEKGTITRLVVVKINHTNFLMSFTSQSPFCSVFTCFVSYFLSTEGTCRIKQFFFVLIFVVCIKQKMSVSLIFCIWENVELKISAWLKLVFLTLRHYFFLSLSAEQTDWTWMNNNKHEKLCWIETNKIGAYLFN